MGLLEDISTRGVSRSYNQHVLRLEPILQAMSKRGLPVSPKRHAEVKLELTEKVHNLLEEMQRMVPDAAKVYEPKFGYKRDQVGAVVGGGTFHGRDKEGNPKPATWAKRFFDVNGIQTERWVKILQWKPAHHGLIRYMKVKGHPVPKDWKTDKETIGELELTRLQKKTGDPLYLKVREYSDLSTLLNNHIKNWTPGPDGLVHPSFYYDTATGQLAARRPNSMNPPHHKESQGPIFRSMIIAPPGYTIMEFDYSGFHSLILGFLARDLLLMRMTRIDVHSFVTAHFKKLPKHELALSMEEGELREYLSWVKKNYRHDRDAKVKHAFLGYNNGMGYRKLWFQYMEYFESQNEAKRVLEMFDVLFPNAKKFREQQAQQAHEQGYLISRSGSIRYFWEVYQWKGGEWKHGPDQEAAKCFQMQNLAHGHLKDAMIRQDDMGWAERASLRNPIHDALIYIGRDELVATASQAIASDMEQPSEIMVDSVSAPAGLSIGVALKIGKVWRDMIELKSWRDLDELERTRRTLNV